MVDVYGAKSCTIVFLAGMFLFVPLSTFAFVKLYRLATKCTEKIESNASDVNNAM